MANSDYATKYIGQTVTVTMDRPMGSVHPEWGFTYSVNYGFVDGTLAPDGGAVDAYVLGVFEPLSTFTGDCIAVIRRKNDDDDKLVVVPCGQVFPDNEIRKITYFQEQYFKSKIIR
jgi:inorganic pyrophosphatase